MAPGRLGRRDDRAVMAEGEGGVRRGEHDGDLIGRSR